MHRTNYWHGRFFEVLAVVMAAFFTGTAAVAGPGKSASGEKVAAADELFTNAQVLRMRIELSPAAEDSLRKRPRKYVPATLREGEKVHTNVLIHLKGSIGSFRKLDEKPGLTLKFGEGGAKFHGLKKFHLNNSVQDSTYLSEWICGEMFRQAGVPTPRVSHALVELNGRRLGLYVLMESVDRPFLARYFQNTRGNVYGQPGNADVNTPLHIMGGHSDTNRTDLRRLAAAARETDPARLKERLSQVLDLERFISFMAMEVMLSHWDGYTFAAHNYRVYHDLDADKMVFIPHDKDQMMRRGNSVLAPRPQGMVAGAVLRFPEGRQRYRERLGELLTNVFVVPVLHERIDALVAKLTPALAAYDPELASTFQNKARYMKIRIARQVQALDEQLRPPEAVRFIQDTAATKNWRMVNDQKDANLARVQESSGKKALWIEANGQTASSWRAKVRLEPGRYAFEGLARAQEIKPLPEVEKGGGAGLRVSIPQQSRVTKLAGDSPWKQLACEFEVTAASTAVELICELRASQGAVWFDEESLRLRRL
jgi:spore coat protein H